MATRTVVKETRSLDHIYDLTHTTSAPADHNKLTARALAVQFEKVPEAAHYFSELRNYPNASYRPGKGRDNFLPKYVDPSWDPRTDVDKGSAHVYGSQRYDIPTKSGGKTARGAPQVMLMGDQQGGTRTVGTQSMYRESEAQTLPYTPDFIAQDSPEVLTLRNLTYENGLPASLFEVKIIERTRQKRLFERMLPPATDEFCLGVRTQLLEQQEFKEWAEREQQIIRLQERRLEMVKQLLAEREKKRQGRNEAKVERLRVKKAEEKDRLFAQTQYRKVKLLRKMYTALNRNQRPEPHGQTVAKYQDKGSTTYAPLMRNGNRPDSNTAKIEIQPSDLKSYAKLVQLERTLPASVLLPPPVLQEGLIPETKRQDIPVVAALNEAMATINLGDQMHLGEAMYKSPLESTGNKSPKRKAGGMTAPVVEDTAPEDEEKAAAILLLQRVLRGRAIQNRMFEGKEKRLDLIEELRASEQLMLSAAEEDKAAVAVMQQKMLEEEQQDEFLGTVVSKALDDLSKELERVQEMRRIDAMMKLAERERRMRQAAEGGRRQAEERLRAREDEIFRQVMKDAHQGTVDSYLEEILTGAVDACARDRALAEAKAQAAKINEVVDSLEGSDPEGCVKELTQSFIIPHAQRELLQRQIGLESKRFIDAAREALDGTMSGVEKSLKDN
eukprot:g6032.t1